MKIIKEFDSNTAQFLMDTGLLFEINRQVLHPLGLALTVRLDCQNRAMGFALQQTDDPAGIRFDDEALAEGFQKLERYMNSGTLDRMAHRLETVGYIVQDGETPEKTSDA